MLRNISKTVKCEAEGSGCLSMRGSGIKQIFEIAWQTSNTSKKKDGLIVQGRGNSLHALGPSNTVDAIMDTVKKIKNDHKELEVAVLGIVPRPKQSKRYEEMRREANRRLQRELCDFKAALIHSKGTFPPSHSIQFIVIHEWP